MESDSDRRFRRLAEAIAHDALLPEDGGQPLELDVNGRTFAYRVRDNDGQLATRRVAIREHVLTVRKGIGDAASVAWGVDLSDEEGWFRFTLVNWDESIATAERTDSGWWTFGAGRGVAPVPPWEADDYQPPQRVFEPFPDPEVIDEPPSRSRPRRRR